MIESNPHLPLDKAAKANTPFKKGTVVYLTVKARDAAKAQRAKFECKGVSDEGDTYVADHVVRFTAILGASGEVTKLFSVDDYTSAQATDQKMVEIYKALSGTAAKPDPLNTEGFQICDEGYLLRYDRGVGQWATVVPTAKALKLLEKVRCTAVEKRKPLGIFSLAFCELAQGAPRRPPGAAGRLFLRYSASENRKIFEKNLIGPRSG